MSLNILTNHPGRKASPSWRAHTTFLPALRNDLWSTFLLGLKLFVRRLEYDCVVLGAGRSDLFYALLQALIPIGRKPTVVIDCLWYERRNRLVQLAKVLLMRIADRSVDRYCVWATREIEDYSRAFGLPKEKFMFVPYHTTLGRDDLSVTDNGYLFSGGDSGRDYQTLIQAVTGLPITLHIASLNPDSLKHLTIPPNVVIRRYDQDAYLEMLAGCTINIVALAPGLLHSAGQQTFLNSMLLGKPTIVTDPAGACDYIEDGIDGSLVEPGNPTALRRAILRLLSDLELAKRMADRAQKKIASGYSTEDHLRRIISVVGELVGADPVGSVTEPAS